jgi:hypothetical protein
MPAYAVAHLREVTIGQEITGCVAVARAERADR